MLRRNEKIPTNVNSPKRIGHVNEFTKMAIAI